MNDIVIKEGGFYVVISKDDPDDRRGYVVQYAGGGLRIENHHQGDMPLRYAISHVMHMTEHQEEES
jgi:hypothetical protein